MFVVAAATAATALVTVAAVAVASAGTPATRSVAHSATRSVADSAAQNAAHQAARSAAHSAAHRAARSVAASRATPAQTRHATGHPGRAHPARGAHRTVRVAHRHSRHARHHAAHKAARHARPYRMYDSVNPSAIPAHKTGAVYSTGRYYATPRQVRHLGHTLWIDITGHNYSASVLDVEPGDATPGQAARWAFHRLHAHRHSLARIYTMRSLWPATRTAIRWLPGWMRSRVRWWIADPTGVPHIVPGSSATQWYWGSRYDVSLAKPNF